MRKQSLVNEASKYWVLFGILAAVSLMGGIFALLQANWLTRIVNGAYIGGQKIGQLLPWFYYLFAIFWARACLIWAKETVGYRLAVNIKGSLRRQTLAHLFTLGPLFTSKEQTGELVNTLSEGIDNLEAYFAKYLPQVISCVLIPPVLLLAVLPLDLAAGLIMLISAPLIPIFMLLIGGIAGRLQERQWEVLSRLSAHFFDILAGLTTLKIFNRSQEQVAVTRRLSEQFRDSTLEVLKIAFLSALVLELTATVSTALVAVTVGLKLLFGTLTFSQAFFILMLAPEFYLPLRVLGSQFHAGLAGRIAAERIFGLLAATPPPMTTGDVLFTAGGPVRLEFEQVSFTYPTGTQPAIQSLSFIIEPGEQLALVGPSGAGKSTVADLLLGFIQPEAGEIRVNGQDLRRLSPASWLGQVAYVPQFPHLFYGTITANILLGSNSEAGVEAAARAAGADEFIRRLPDGYDTVIGQGGLGLSGGEAQRIAIARAFYRNAPILILDEPMTGLDAQNEAIIRQALLRLMAGKSVLIIAHRLTTAARADRILVLDRGKAVESGNHQELLASRGLIFSWLQPVKELDEHFFSVASGSRPGLAGDAGSTFFGAGNSCGQCGPDVCRCLFDCAGSPTSVNCRPFAVDCRGAVFRLGSGSFALSGTVCGP